MSKLIEFDSPILAIVLLPVASWSIWLTRKQPARPRWAISIALLALWVAAAGVTVGWHRPPRVTVMVDVSPSTRGAAFRDPKSVEARLTPLLAGRPYALHYFADGLLTSSAEPSVDRTRLAVPADAEAFVLLSDGRLTTPGGLPPTYPVVDPTLERPSDARVRAVTFDEHGHAAADVVSAGVERPLSAKYAVIALPAGPAVVALPQGVVGRVGFAAGDRWPENDLIDVPSNDRPVRRVTIGLDLPGFERMQAGDVRAADELIDVGVIALPTGQPVPAAIESYVRDLGGTLALLGPPGEAEAAGRRLSPLSAEPPAGPQRWTILLDASGSMAADAGAAGTRWRQAVAAAREAAGRLPDGARVTVLAFARDVRTIADGMTPAEAANRLAGDAGTSPGGPTGLRAALEAVARAGGPTRLLVVTDGDVTLGEIDGLSRSLARARVRVDAVAAGASPGLSALCEATGGRVSQNVTAGDWATVLSGIAGRGEQVPGQATAEGFGAWRGRTIGLARRWPAFAKADAEVLAAVDGRPVAAVWPAGLGRVVAVAADGAGDALAAGLIALERPAADARYSVVWDEAGERVRVTATDANVPINGPALLLRREGITTVFEAVGPGQYEAGLTRSTKATGAVIVDGTRVVARHAIAGRAAAEFDVVGNDAAALATIARQSGGRVVEVGDNRPIEFDTVPAVYSLRKASAVVAAFSMLVAIYFLKRR